MSAATMAAPPTSRAWARFRTNRAAMIGLAFTTIIVLAALSAPYLPIYDPMQMGRSFLPPSWSHLMGTDALGSDIFSNIILGARTSLIVGFCAVLTSTTIGVLVGALAGYFGGTVDTVLMRVTEMFQILPQFFLAIVIVALFGSSIWNVVLVIGALTWPVTARLLRAEFLTLRRREFVDAARSLGMSQTDIIFREIMPNALPPIIVNCTLQISSAILLQTSLSFLGLGDPNAMSWGTMLHNAQDYFSRAWWMAAFPGMALFITTLSLNLVGDGLNDALNPK
ncbi:ABC transporter permease [Aureimonas fodinaquatilis]|uniref:ABC transporter permease n=1 Tax=Aureimonas fodinaquatilis TaxID=2565783 RepID=A0A5B0E1K7_9HYPH|nr:ABC transporter permease [Aureimonas fodinaquatilis]KAA0971851.1 ABC transporter permease [Aureimonas fodinaquatilis]